MLRWIRERLSRDDGVSLVETLIAMLIVSFVLMALAAGTTTAMAAMQQNERHTRATHFGNQWLENLQSISWNDLTFYRDDEFRNVNGDVVAPPPNSVIDTTRDRLDSPAPIPYETFTTAGTEGRVTYRIVRSLTWIDDPCDGYGAPAPSPTRACSSTGATPAAGTDPDPRDYVLMSVTLGWTWQDRDYVQTYEAQRTSPLDGAPPQPVFEITSHRVTPEPVLITAATNGTVTTNGGVVMVTVTVSMPATAVYLTVTGPGGVVRVGPNQTMDGAGTTTFTRTISGTWDEGFYTFKYQAARNGLAATANCTTPVDPDRPCLEESVWVGRTADPMVVTVRNFTRSPSGNIRKATNTAEQSVNYNGICNAIGFTWQVQSAMTPSTYVEVYDAINDSPVTSDDVLLTTLTATAGALDADGFRTYTATLPNGFRIPAQWVRFRAFARDPGPGGLHDAGRDEMNLPLALTWSSGAC